MTRTRKTTLGRWDRIAGGLALGVFVGMAGCAAEDAGDDAVHEALSSLGCDTDDTAVDEAFVPDAVKALGGPTEEKPLDAALDEDKGGVPRGYYLSTVLWTDFQIPVCWETTGWTSEKSWVQLKIQNTWEASSGVDFTGWGTCATGAKGIRIRIADENPLVDELGRNLDGLVGGMTLNFAFSAWRPSCSSSPAIRRSCVEASGVHEFGHALGLAHEHNRPDAGAFPSCTADPQGTNGNTLVGEFDADSVMNYCYGSSWSGVLSAGDIATVQQMYPNFGTDVGVIPQAGTTCPARYGEANYDRVTIHMDDEDSGNANNRAGWIGAIVSNSNTTLSFCRVGGSQFRHLASSSSRDSNYAVLKLGTRCPNGSTEFERYIDNEDDANANWTLGDLRPNWSNSSGTRLKFCLFAGSTITSFQGSALPTLPIGYGVFAQGDFDFASEVGWFYTDDEDDSNANTWSGDPRGQSMVNPGANTTFKVWRR